MLFAVDNKFVQVMPEVANYLKLSLIILFEIFALAPACLSFIVW